MCIMSVGLFSWLNKPSIFVFFILDIWLLYLGYQQGIDGSARKPALRQDTGYMVEKTYHDIAPYLGTFGAYIMPQ